MASSSSPVLQALSQYSSLSATEWDFSGFGTDINFSHVKAIAEALKVNKAVLKLNLKGNKIGVEGAKVVAEAVKFNNSLQILNLYGNELGVQGTKVMAEAVKTNRSIQDLNLGWNYIRTDGAMAMAEAVKVNSSLRTLNLGYNNVGNEGARAMAEALQINGSLRTLILENNSIGGEGARAMAEALKINGSLRTLILESNNIGSEGAKAMAEAMRVNSSLQDLILENNNICVIDSEGAKAMAEAVKVNSSLQTLNLGYNNINNTAAKALAEAVKVNNSLRTLILICNQIGVEGAKAMAEAVKFNTSLQTLNLGSVDSDFQKAIDAVLVQNKQPKAHAAPAPAASVPAAPAAARNYNRWGDGLPAPAAGIRHFFPLAWVPQRSVQEALQEFAFRQEDVENIMAYGKKRSESLRHGDVFIDPEYAAAIYAYTLEQPKLYADLNYACRTTGKQAAADLKRYQDFLYHLEHAVTCTPNFVGRVYRGARDKFADEYTVGNVITWQQFTSTSRAASQIVTFLTQLSNGDFFGSIFVMDVKSGKDISICSMCQGEEETLLRLNSHFKVVAKPDGEQGKQALVPKLSQYNLKNVDVYLLQQL